MSNQNRRFKSYATITSFCMCLVVCASTLFADDCLRIEQEVKGLPGHKDNEAAKQRLYIAKNKLRLDELIPNTKRFLCRCILQSKGDSFQVYELLHKTQSYRVSYELQNIQEDRDLAERQMLGVLSTKQLAAFHLQSNLKRDVERTSSPGKTLTVGEKSYKCRRVVVTENGLDIIDAQVADQVGHGIDYYRFYRKIGVFSDEVLSKLEKVKGLPLSATIRVVTRKPKWHKLEIVIKGLTGNLDKDKSFFEIPEGWKKEEKPLKAKCYYRNCNNMVETANPAGKFRYKGRWVYFCSKECRNSFITEYKKRWRKAKKNQSANREDH